MIGKSAIKSVFDVKNKSSGQSNSRKEKLFVEVYGLYYSETVYEHKI